MAEAKTKSAKLKSSDFVHLHNHTHYSVLDGLQKIPKMVARTAELGMEAVAITDHGTLSGAIEFFKEATLNEVKPIIGMETYVAARSHLDKDPVKDKTRNHLVLIAMNDKGYKNLMRLATIASLDGFYYKPRIDKDLIKKHSEGLICLSGCINGEVGAKLRENQYDEAKKAAKWYKNVFDDRYYLELQDHGHQWAEQGKVNKDLLKLADELDIKAVVTSDAHYLTPDDQEAHEALLCVQTGSYLSDEDRMSLKDMDLYLEDPKEIIKRWNDNPEVIKNTKEIADRCQIDIPLGNILIPKFPLPKGQTDEKKYLEELVYTGLAWRYGGKTNEAAKKLTVSAAKKTISKEIQERAKFELDTMFNMGFASYFLIVQDFINWGKERGIVFGPGRGSAAGSIVSYALNITDLDPLEYDLLFERFLNPDRISMPDIDIDIQDNRRDEVIQYCVDKYGQDRVAHIVTFGKMAARNAIRDVSRVLEVSYADADRLAKLVPPPVQGRHTPLEIHIQESSELRDEYENNEQSKRVIDLAIRLEGTIRSHGVHAAGVVIAPDDIVNYVPLEMAQKGVVATQYSMYPIEELGLLKMDFLGLSNLTTIKNALRIVRKVWDKEIDINNIPLDDEKVYDLLSQGDTIGIFQFESGGMKRYLKRLKPTVFEDVVAMGALYRPGPLSAGLTDRFIARKQGEQSVSYEHELMKPALESTYGVLVYQEQVMRIARDMCGFTGGQADTLRKAIGKKNSELMAKMKTEFVDGMVKVSKVEPAFAEKFWKDLEGFADYAFNKSHSASYGLISYQTAYLKAHYPQAFMAALMTSDFNDIDRLAIDINECRHMDIKVLPPDINESFVEFAVVPKTLEIRFGMAAIKNVGTGAVEEIIEERDKNGPFQSVEDFISRVPSKVANRKIMESLIKTGAFDRFQSRAKLLHNLDKIIGYSAKVHKEANSGQIDLFDGTDTKEALMAKLEFEEIEDEVPEKELLQWERDLLGIYLSKHPLDQFEKMLEEITVPIGKLTKKMDGRKVTIGGVIQESKEVTTKNGAKMAFITVEDKTGELEIIVFPDAYRDKAEVFERDNVVQISGKLNTKDRQGNEEELKVLVDEAEILTYEQAKSYKTTGKKMRPPKEATAEKSKPQTAQIKRDADDRKLYLLIKDPEDDQLLKKLKRTLSKHTGDTNTILVLGEKKDSAVKLPFGVKLEEELTEELESMLGDKAVAVK